MQELACLWHLFLQQMTWVGLTITVIKHLRLAETKNGWLLCTDDMIMASNVLITAGFEMTHTLLILCEALLQ